MRGASALPDGMCWSCVWGRVSRPPEAAANTEVSGVVHGIPFEYTCGSTIRSTNFWGRRWSRARGLVGAVRRINRQRRAGPVEAVLLYSKSSLDAAVLHSASRGVRSVYIVDLCELPFPTPWGLVLGKVRRSVYNCTFFRWFDAAIVISDRLRRHAAAFGSRGMALLNAPVMVGTDEFRPMPGAAESPPVITYCGLLNEQKDGVATLIRVFARVASDVPQVRLRLIGDTYHGTRIPEFRAIAERLGIADKVSFTGTVARSEVPVLLARSSVLVLARPSSPQAEAGMPTKVAEYLASGVPTVLTLTGETGTFLKDGVSAYLVPPQDEPALAAALRHVLLHTEEAANVGRCGREVAVRSFDYRVAGARVAAFVADLGARS